MPCPNFFSYFPKPSNPLNPKTKLDAEEFHVYTLLQTLAEIATNPELQEKRNQLLATFNDKNISNNTYKIKIAFMTAVKDALFFYLQGHGPLFNCTESKQFAIKNIPVIDCEHALRIIADIVHNGSDPESQNIAKSSRLYQLIRQFYTSPAGEDVKDLKTGIMAPNSMLYLALEKILSNNRKLDVSVSENPITIPPLNPRM